jgi:hypothetical protein
MEKDEKEKRKGKGDKEKGKSQKRTKIKKQVNTINSLLYLRSTPQTDVNLATPFPQPSQPSSSTPIQPSS